MTTLIILFSAILTGFLLRRRHVPAIPERFTSALVWLLLFFFGVSIGSDHSILGRIDRFGLEALVIAVAGIAGSVLAAMILSRMKSKRSRHEK